MLTQTFMHLFYAVFSLEFFAMLAGLINVHLAVRTNQWTWAFGIITVSLYLIIFFQVKLYADMGLQAIFLCLQFYGWYQWEFGGEDQTHLLVHQGNWLIYLVSLFFSLFLFFAISYLLSTYTDSNTILMDAFVTALSLVAQWMMSKKLIENWLVWAIADSVSVILYSQKALYMTAGLYFVFLLMCINGYQVWHKKITANN